MLKQIKSNEILGSFLWEFWVIGKCEDFEFFWTEQWAWFVRNWVIFNHGKKPANVVLKERLIRISYEIVGENKRNSMQVGWRLSRVFVRLNWAIRNWQI